MSAADRIRSHSRINSTSTPQTWELDETLMYGSYSRDLSMHARVQAREARLLKRRQVSKGFYSRTSSYSQSCSRLFKQFRYHIISKVGEDWIFLTILGVVMALLSFLMDFIIGKFQYARMWLYASTAQWIPLQFTVWVLFPMVLVCFSSGFVQLVGPNAIGSGIPEMKTILRGVVLKEYLTARTLVAKIVGLCTSLGCGLPIGKEGPFVHVASIAATLLGKFVTSVTGIYENESRTHEMLAAACAVGVACTFAAPIGGVLFSIEVTSSFFAVKNYWRGFYSAVCGALVFRLLAIVFHREGYKTITALFKTNLRQDFPFDPAELLAFAVIGIVCGFAGALFVYTHRCFVMFIRGHKRMKAFLLKNRFIFPATVMFIIAGTIYPPGLGQYMAGQLTNGEALNELFTNVTWSDPRAYMDVAEKDVLNHWSGPHENVFLTLTCFIVMRTDNAMTLTQFLATAMATALPVPSGVFMPIFTIGAAFGRLIGESMSVWFPSGIGGQHIVPGGYAIVGAAALSGSVTHTISTAVIVFEITGQIAHVLPCVIAVLLSNAVAHTMQPSFYDSIIRIKKLPYLPDIVNTTIVNAHRIFVEDIMIKDVVMVASTSTVREVNHILEKFTFKAFPFVDSKESRILLGSIERYELEAVVDASLSSQAKLDYLQSFPRPGEFVQGNTLTIPGSKAPLARIKASDLNLSAVDSVPSTSVDSPGRFAVFAVEEQMPDSDEDDLNLYSAGDLSDNDTLNDKPKRSILKKNHPSGKQKVARFDNSKTPLKDSEITPAMEALWLEHQMQMPLQFEKCHIDPAPFQLVERTSLFKIHSLFSLLSLHHAYVTNMGRLVGIVSLKEVRNAIQGEVNGSGVLLHERKVSLVPTSVTLEGVSIDCDSGIATYKK